MIDLFSEEYFVEHLRKHVEMHAEFTDKTDAMNSYYRSIVSTLVTENLTKCSETLRRIRNLEAAYATVKSQDF
ncbi:protein YvfG [Bacillus salitolerans]|uniref:Protein YvfG n=1 Tax=Bacillus salitolerans TaxID=1437434 RepID=A0ABW4LX13_9BACI